MSPRSGRPTSAGCLPGCASNWCRWWRQSARAGRRPDMSVVSRPFPVDVQEAFGREAARAIGFDFSRGRLDVTAHPFCTTLGPHDCRITTRFDGDFLQRRLFRHLARGRPRDLRAGAPARAVRPAAGRSDFAGHPRVAVADVGEHGRPQPRLLGAFLPRGAAAVSRRAGRRGPGRLLLRAERRAAVADSHRGRRSHVQLAHPRPFRVGAGAPGRPTAAGRLARGVEREVSASTWGCCRPTTPRAFCRTSIGRPA